MKEGIKKGKLLILKSVKKGKKGQKASDGHNLGTRKLATVKRARLPKNQYWTTRKIIREFHRAEDGFMAFYRRRPNEDRLCPVRSIRPSYLLKFESGTRWLKIAEDGYFTPLAYYKHDGAEDDLSYGPAYRRQSGVKYLNSCFVDLDFYNEGLSFEQTLRKVRRMVRERQIPKPSIIADSGSGIWLFWLLHDAQNKKAPPKGNPKHFGTIFQLWRRIEESLIDRLRHLGADSVVKDGARLARLPGSVNRKARRRVRYSPQYPSRSQRISYTLPEMAKCLGLPLAVEIPQAPNGKKNKVSIAVRKQMRQARRALLEGRLDRLQRLEKHRNGLNQGTREMGLLLFAAVMKSLGWKPRLINKEIVRLGARCKPPLDAAASLARVKAADGKKWIRDKTIADWLRVTPKEKSILELRWPLAGEDDSAAPNPSAADARMRERKKILNRLLRRYGVMSARRLAELFLRRGINVSRATAARDLKSA